MNRYEFEYEYAKKYLNRDLTLVNDNREGEGYTDHHIDLCWKVQQLKNNSLTGIISDSEFINDLEW